MIYLISYPRSGNTAFRYLLELLTGKPTNGLCPGSEWNPRDRLQSPLIHSGDDFVCRKSHDFRGVEDSDMVIFLVRDPLESVIRHNEKQRGIDKVEKLRGYLDNWFKLLQQYDDFKGNKMLVYYDELVKVSDRVSRDIYPNPQSTHKDFHKEKLSGGMRGMCKLYMSENYGELIKKYL